MQASNNVPLFDPESLKYKCCCSSCHAKKGLKIILIISSVCAVLNFLGSLAQDGGPSIFQLVLVAVVNGCAFYGLHKEKHNFIIPYIVLEILCVIMICVVIVVAIAAMFGASFFIFMVVEYFANSHYESGNGTHHYMSDWFPPINVTDTDQAMTVAGFGAMAVSIIAVVIILVAIICLLFELWYISIALGAYRYLRDKALFGTAPDGQKRLSVAYYNEGGGNLVSPAPPPYAQAPPNQQPPFGSSLPAKPLPPITANG